MPRRNAQGTGSIRQRQDGTWEARFTPGRDPGTGKQQQKSIYGKTQQEVRKKLTAALAEVDKGTYQEPSKLHVGEWLDIWLAEYTGGIKSGTLSSYKTQIEINIKPAFGAVKLSSLKPHQIQKHYNSLQQRLSAKSIKNVHGVFHKALQQAYLLGYIPLNPADRVQLPKIVKKDIKPLTEKQITDFINVIKGSEYESILKVDMFTGLRQGEIMGLTWDRVDFKAGTILIDRQLRLERKAGGKYLFDTTKTEQVRKIKPAPTVMEMLKQRKKEQAQERLKAGNLWDDSEFPGLVFTNPYGKHYTKSTLTHNVTKFGEKIGIDGLRFHDLRHTYAVSSILAGDDIKTISSNLGHTTVSITLDIYAHFTDDMRNESARRMDNYMKRFANL